MFEICCWAPHARRSIGGERSCELAAHPPAPLPLARGAAALRASSDETQKVENQCSLPLSGWCAQAGCSVRQRPEKAKPIF